MIKIKKNSLIITTVIILLSMNSCCKKTNITIDFDELQKIYSSTVKPSTKLTGNVDLYVDYSTCVKEAVSNSQFFSNIRPRITGANPTLFAIRGDEITKISSDKDVVNQELNKIIEVSYANIKGAVEKICNSSNQAILITDGEYWTRPEGERIDLPYMKDAFIKWLNKGLVAHIVSESYVEKLNGRNFNKLRFYFFFTDDKIENNIFEEVSKANNFKTSSVSFFKMTNSDVKVKREKMVNHDLTSVLDTTNNYDFVEIQDEWEDIFQYVLYAVNDNGNPIPEGKPLFENIIIENMNLNNYKIQDLEIKAYNINDMYLDSIHNKNLIVEMKDAFQLINSKGILSIKITEELQNYLNNCQDNLIRIDIALKNTQNIEVKKDNFSWLSLTQNNTENISIYESIKQALDNPETNPIKRNNGIIHSIFIKTNEYKN